MARKRKRVNRGKRGSVVQSAKADLLRQAISWIVDEKIFSKLALHGNTSWIASQLVVLAVFWVWSDKGTLTGAFVQAEELSISMLGTVAVTTYQGLMNALVTWTGKLLPLIWRQLHVFLEKAGGTYWRIGRWLPLAVDGTRVTTPRTKSNEIAFSAKNYGKGKMARSRKRWKNKKARSKKLSAPVKPQIWLTLLWHMGLKVPWSWKTGPSNSSERSHFSELLGMTVFPENTLFCGDAGFVGYDLWTTILAHGHNFLIRVGGNVRLLRDLGFTRRSNDLVYLWPNEAIRKKELPLVLRLMEFQGPRGTVYLATNVMSEKALSHREASQLYRLRWGVELQFRSYKQTFGRSKLRSRTAEHAIVELDWSLLGLGMIQLYAVKEQIRVGSPPQQSSVSLALSVIQDAMRSWRKDFCNPQELLHRLRCATKDKYERKASKRARYRPNYKDPPSATKPKIVLATKQQIKEYQTLTTAG
jgi:Transposase DDE domain